MERESPRRQRQHKFSPLARRSTAIPQHPDAGAPNAGISFCVPASHDGGMRLVTFTPNTAEAAPRAGVRVGHRVLDIEAASRVDGEPLPRTMKELLRAGRGALSRTAALAKAAQVSAGRYSGAMYEERAVRFLPPVPDPDKFVCVEKQADKVTGFAKGASTLVGQDAKVQKTPAAGHLDVETELVFVIG